MSEGVLLSLAPGAGRPWEAALERAVKLLQQGGVVSFATDTYYALGADPLNDLAVARVFSIKHRRRSSPLPVLVSGVAQAESLLGSVLPQAAMPLVEAFWPGPLTLVLPAVNHLPAGVAGPDGTVGLRWPDWPVAQALLDRFGAPVTGSSANRSGNGPPVSGEAVLADLGRDVDLVLDSGSAPGGDESTVVGVVEKGGRSRLRVIREGRISVERLEQYSGLTTDQPPAGIDRN